MKTLTVSVITAFFLNILLNIAGLLITNNTSQLLKLAIIFNSTGLVLSISWVLMKKNLRRKSIQDKGI